MLEIIMSMYNDIITVLRRGEHDDDDIDAAA